MKSRLFAGIFAAAFLVACSGTAQQPAEEVAPETSVAPVVAVDTLSADSTATDSVSIAPATSVAE